MIAQPVRLMIGTVLAGILLNPSLLRGDEPVQYNEHEKAFQQLLTGAEMVGTFTVDGKNDNNPPKPERYQIQSATKLKQGSDYWVIVARVEYGGKKATLPIPVTVKVLWAGDTPMISLTDLTIPSLGTFTSRVLFHGNRYAGTWQHDEVGGHMYGLIEKPAKEAASERQP